MPLSLCFIAGYFLPAWFSLKATTGLAGGLFLFLSGLELEVLNLRQEFRHVAKTWLGAFLVPLAAGFGLCLALPDLFHSPPDISPLKTAALVGIAMSVSAVPVILRLLQEMELLTTTVGRRVVSIAVLCDLSAWVLFIPILPATDLVTWMKSHMALLLFFVGVGLALAFPKNEGRHKWIQKLNYWIVGPLFFLGIGQSLDFSRGLNLPQLLLIFVIASISKVAGVWISTYRSGIPRADRGLMAISLNARGAMEIVLASFAFRAGVIAPDLFTSLIVMAIGTSMLVKPIRRLASNYGIVAEPALPPPGVI